MAKIFVSYCHAQGQWVYERLAPCLRAGGADVLIDRERFRLGKAVVGQMDATQDLADKHVLVLSRDYYKSRYCQHEMNRALRVDPRFERGLVLPVKVDNSPLPAKIQRPNPLYADLTDDSEIAPWDRLLQQCDADLGSSAPAWLKARDQIVRFLKRAQSVNLVVGDGVAWRGLLEHLARDHLPGLGRVDLASGATSSRPALVHEILKVLSRPMPVPAVPDDLVVLHNALSEDPVSYLVLAHFDLVDTRQDYDVNLFWALRTLMMEKRKLVLLIQSHRPFATLLPKNHPISAIDVKTVPLERRP